MHEAYSGQRTSLSLPFPLQKIDYARDTVDLIGGIATRKIKTAVIDGGCEPTATEREGVFYIPLLHPIRPGSRIKSDFEALTVGAESGISPSDDGSGILLKISPDIKDENDVKDYLSEFPLEISYVLKTYELVPIPKLQLAEFTADTEMEILSEAEPSAIIAEYRD